MKKEFLLREVSKNKFLILGFLLIIGLFYWFQYRPTEIRKRCYLEATNNGTSTISGFASELRKGKYDACLAKFGIK